MKLVYEGTFVGLVRTIDTRPRGDIKAMHSTLILKTADGNNNLGFLLNADQATEVEHVEVGKNVTIEWCDEVVVSVVEEQERPDR